MKFTLNTLLAVILAIAVAVAVAIFLINQSDDDNSTAGTPTSTPLDTGGAGTINARGELSFLNGVGDLVLANPDGAGQKPITASGGILNYRWSPDGNLIAAAFDLGGNRSVSVLRPDGEHVFDIPDATDFKWSLDSTRVAVVRPSSVVVFDTNGAEIRQISDAVKPEWSPDGATLAVVKLDSEGLGVPVLVDLASGEEAILSLGLAPGAPDYNILWNPTGMAIAYANGIFDPSTGDASELPGVASQWSPDGRLLLVAGSPEPAENATNGLLLDYTQGGQQVIGLYIRNDPGGTPPWLFANRWMDWSDDSQYLLYLDPNPFAPTARLYNTLGPSQERFSNIKGENPSISPAGTHAAFTSDGSVWVFALDGSALRPVADGSLPQFRPGVQ